MLVPLIFGCFYASVLLYALAGGMALRYMKNADAAFAPKSARLRAHRGRASPYAVLAARWLLWTQTPPDQSQPMSSCSCSCSTTPYRGGPPARQGPQGSRQFLSPARRRAGPSINALAAPQYLLAPAPLFCMASPWFCMSASRFQRLRPLLSRRHDQRRLPRPGPPPSKRRRTDRLFYHLPSLEQLDQSLMKLIAWGYLFFLITLCLGAGWAWMDRALLGPHWWLSTEDCAHRF